MVVGVVIVKFFFIICLLLIWSEYRVFIRVSKEIDFVRKILIYLY